MKHCQLHNVYLGLGTNLGDKEKNMQLAIQNINKRIGKVIACSAFFTTAPVGFKSDNLFLNAACQVMTNLSPSKVLEYTQEIEREMGRINKSYNKQYSDRIIDIDVLLYDDLIYESEELILPHPHLHEREFVLNPLKEIAGDITHPVLKIKIKEIFC